MIKNREIYTPDQNILHGITRKRVIELAGNVNIQPVKLEEILAADEVFMTSTTKKILPITQIDHQRIGTGIPGPMTLELMEAFDEMELVRSK